MSDFERIAETAAKQAEKVSQTSKRGGILAGLLMMFLIACGLVGLLAYCGFSDRIVGASLVIPALILSIVVMVVRETIRSKQLVLLGSEKIIMEAFRHGLVGTREHVLTGDPAPKALEDMRPELEKLKPGSHHHHESH